MMRTSIKVVQYVMLLIIVLAGHGLQVAKGEGIAPFTLPPPADAAEALRLKNYQYDPTSPR